MPATSKPETAFARRLQQDWAWKQTPPLRSITAIAQAVRLPKQTIDNYLNRGQIPSMQNLLIIAEHTGLDLIMLIRDCGFDIPKTIIDATAFKQYLMDKFQPGHAYTFEQVIQAITIAEAEFTERQTP